MINTLNFAFLFFNQLFFLIFIVFLLHKTSGRVPRQPLFFFLCKSTYVNVLVSESHDPPHYARLTRKMQAMTNCLKKLSKIENMHLCDYFQIWQTSNHAHWTHKLCESIFIIISGTNLNFHPQFHSFSLENNFFITKRKIIFLCHFKSTILEEIVHEKITITHEINFLQLYFSQL